MSYRLLLCSLVLTLTMLSGCASFQSESEVRRIVSFAGVPPCTIEIRTTKERVSRPCTELEQIQFTFSTVRLGWTTLADLAAERFGPPYSTREIIPSPEIKARLTKTNDGGMELLDKEVRSCITQAHASYRCKMAIFTDSYDHRIGANNPLIRMTSIRKTDITSSWSWEAVFVAICPHEKDEECLDSAEEDYVVIYKQFRPSEDPSKTHAQRWPILDSHPFAIKKNVP